jgi:hypothetical protein
MEAALPGEVEGKQVIAGHCAPVRHLKCSPLSGGKQYQCAYQYGEGRLGVAIVERREGTFWRWVSGPRNCSIVTSR